MLKRLAIIIVAVIPAAALAMDCPEGAKSCKVVTMTPEEINSMDMIFNAAMFANRMQMDGLVAAWRQKIFQSPDGAVKESKPESKK